MKKVSLFNFKEITAVAVIYISKRNFNLVFNLILVIVFLKNINIKNNSIDQYQIDCIYQKIQLKVEILKIIFSLILLDSTIKKQS